MISLNEAKAKVLNNVKPLGVENASIKQLVGRVLAQEVQAKRTQPPAPLSAMDGYAVKASEARSFKVIGQSSAGHEFNGEVKAEEAVRIFTGAHVPMGADSIIMQEDVNREGETITLTKPFTPNKHIRPKGLDFKTGETFFKAGHLVETPHLGLLAAMNYKELAVYRKPRVAILSTGDELVEAGEATQESQIVSTNALVLAQIARKNGAIVTDYGICKDNADDLSKMIAKIRADKPDLLLTSGGASVGDYDLVQQTLGAAGMALSFWKIAMRPGKPLIHGKLGEMRILGLPGNPVSSFVCGHLFVIPLIKALQGRTDVEPHFYEGVLQTPLKANDERADFLRGCLKGEDLEAFALQDSSMLSVLAKANVLIFREAFDKAREVGEKIKYLKI